jgi:vitamin B12 transporter
MKKTVRISAVFALIATCAFAQVQDSTKVNQLNEVVISDTKFAQSREKSGKIITIISQEELQKKSGQTLAMILSQVAGLEINGNQSFGGKNLGTYIRGGRNRQVLVMIDGVPVTDGSGISMEYDLRLLPVDQVERIEILKGASSTLYGTGAATGVINVTLKKANTKPIQGNVYVNMGSNNTAQDKKYNGNDSNQGFSINGKVAKVDYLTSINSTQTNGMSEAKGENYEEDVFSRVSLNQKIGFNATQKLRFDFFGNYDRIKNTFDNTYNPTFSSDNLENRGTTVQFRAGFNSSYQYDKGEFVINAGGSTIERNLFVFNSDLQYNSRNVNVDAFNKYLISKQFFVIIGTQFQFNELRFDAAFGTINRDLAKFSIFDPYTTLVYNSNFGLNVNAGLRMNHHTVYGEQLVYTINPSFSFVKNIPVKLITSYSTAYITPSLFQLFDPFSGNTKLTPEENSTIEAGFETQLWNKKLHISAVGFYREETNTVGVDPNFVYFNIQGTNKARGVETAVHYIATSKLTVKAHYTFNELDKSLQRLNPKHKVNADVAYQFSPRFHASLQYQYLSARMDAFGFPAQAVLLDNYQLVHATLRYELIKNRMTIFSNATNIFNEDFVENIGYSTRGRNFRIGVTVQL